jgi:hypothetical protein
MSPERGAHYSYLPIIPEEVLRRHRVLEKFDNRFRACARLLQALWREDQGLPIGTHVGRTGQPRRIGSLLGSTAADAGRNFLTPEVAHLVRREVTYQQAGALIDAGRLFGNLLSSMPLAFNLFGPLRLDLGHAAKVVRSLIPDIDLARVLHVLFEHSPGRRDDELTGDRSAFDVAIVYERADGERGLLAIEQKYSEGASSCGGELGSRYDELARSSELYKNPMTAVLRTGPCQQLFREHLLTFAARFRGDYAEARFILIAPRHNHLLQQGARLYASHLAEPGPDAVPFLRVELEQVIEAIGWAGELGYAQQLHDRYINWCKIDAVVEQALRSKARDWAVVPPALAAPVTLVSKAA